MWLGRVHVREILLQPRSGHMQTTCREWLLALVTPKLYLGHIWHSTSWIMPKLGQISAFR